MDINKVELQEETKEKDNFVEELINENIKLMEENIRILLENKQLVKRLEELSSLNRLLSGSREAGECAMIFKVKGKGEYKN
jgi:regulator of replication initiation timing